MNRWFYLKAVERGSGFALGFLEDLLYILYVKGFSGDSLSGLDFLLGN